MVSSDWLWNFLLCRKQPDFGTFRAVHAFQRTPTDVNGVAVVSHHEHYADNVVITSKYKVWNFVPKNLFEQFRRVANFYFLCVVLVQFAILDKTPVSPSTSLVPLVFVISVTALKQGFEDWKRHKADKEVNNRAAFVAQGGQLKQVYSRHIKVGDIVKVSADEEFPCDLVVISTSEDDGQCHITTANLDGETNLKMRSGLPLTARLNTPDLLDALSCTVECDHPEYDMYKFNGRMIIRQDGRDSVHSLSHSNLLLRGARLKNTVHVFGLAVYTGKETKMALNQQDKKAKFSSVERSMNKYLMVFLGVLLVETALCTILKYIWQASTSGAPWYISDHPPADFVEVFVDFLAFLILFNYVIPISLYVTVELQKFVGALFFDWDLEMYHEATDEPAQANTSDLNEELGQIEYVFSDKTGTLTENDMQFRNCSVDGVVYAEQDGQLVDTAGKQSPMSGADLSPHLKEMITTLALCHTVQADELPRTEGAAPTKYKYRYQASSPDEKAFVEAAARLGVVYRGTRADHMELELDGVVTRYKVMHVLEFDSLRKRMSNILQSSSGEYLLLCKGAESHVLDRIKDGHIQTTQEHINKFAEVRRDPYRPELVVVVVVVIDVVVVVVVVVVFAALLFLCGFKTGLRTLAIASRRLSPEQFEEIDQKLTSAQCAIEDREEQLAKVFDEVERDLVLVGATAIEDRLQDGVKTTIESLRVAGIKVWVLTGDKQETAVNISHSCGHFQTGMEIVYLTGKKTAAEVDDVITEYKAVIDKTTPKDHRQFALVVDGPSLAITLKQFKDEFVSIGIRCVAVLCCRMSPLQKAQVVQVIKSSDTHPITLAIGDGANDCSMIQEAHVGCGIMGKEGRQAVALSDYAFHRFRFLQRALLVHGHYYYTRLSFVVLYFFYKNVAFITPQFFFQFFCGYSATPIYASVFLTCFNIFFTSLPILLYGVSEQNLRADTLASNPLLYRDLNGNELLSTKQFLWWMASGFWHALVIFFGSRSLFYRGSLNEDLHEYGVHAFGTFVFTCVVIVTNLKLALMSHYWTWITHSFFAISVLSYVALLLLLSAFFWPWPFLMDWFGMELDLELYDVFFMLCDCWPFWLGLVAIVLVCVIPDMIVTSLLRHFRPSKVQSLQERRTCDSHGNPHDGWAPCRMPPVPHERWGFEQRRRQELEDNLLEPSLYFKAPK